MLEVALTIKMVCASIPQKMNKATSSVFFAALLAISLIVLAGVSNKLIHGLWMYFKFYSYGGGGYTTLNIAITMITIFLSVAIIVICVVVEVRYKFPRGCSKLSKAVSIANLTIILALSLSPIGRLV